MQKTEEIRIQVARSKQILRELDSKSLDANKNLALKFWNKFIQNNECMAGLIKDDYIDEAYLIFRLSMEHLFNMFALVRSADFIEKIKNNSEIGIPKALKAISNNEAKAEKKTLAPENSKLLKEAIIRCEESPLKDLGYSIYNAAQASELKDFYDSVYRVISISHAHSTFLSTLKNHSESDVAYLIKNSVDFLRIACALVKEEYYKKPSK